MGRKGATKILIADDHALVVEGVKALIDNAKGLKVSGVASSGTQVLDLVAAAPPHLILMDINMPGLDGIETIRQLRETHPDLPIIVLSMYNSLGFISNALELGANGYLLKNTNMGELQTAIEVVMQGEVYLSKEVEEVYQTGQIVMGHDDTQNSVLSDREIEIVKLLVQEKTQQEIAKNLNLSPNTVQTHRRNILVKLNVKNLAGIVKYAVQRGWE